ncbi:unnamed protein product, partial [Darwinula stevensoni]
MVDTPMRGVFREEARALVPLVTSDIFLSSQTRSASGPQDKHLASALQTHEEEQKQPENSNHKSSPQSPLGLTVPGMSWMYVVHGNEPLYLSSPLTSEEDEGLISDCSTPDNLTTSKPHSTFSHFRAPKDPDPSVVATLTPRDFFLYAEEEGHEVDISIYAGFRYISYSFNSDAACKAIGLYIAQ